MPDVLCLPAHPDDEIFCADLLAWLTNRGHSLHVACLTRGGGGRRYGDPPRATPATLGAVREQEMRAAARVLGADGVSFLGYSFLGYVDRPATEDGHRPPEHDPAQLRDDIRGLIESCAPALVLTHGSGGEYGHPDHRLLHERTTAAVDGAHSSPALYTFAAYHPEGPSNGTINRWDWADLLLDDAPYGRAKAQALLCHRTRWTVFVNPQDTLEDYRDALVDNVASIPAETYCCHRPGRPGVPPAVLSEWLGRDWTSAPRRPGEVMWDRLEEYRHKARIAVGEGLLALRQRLHGGAAE